MTLDVPATLRAIYERSDVLGECAALMEAIVAFDRIATIRAEHEAGAVTTAGGKVVYADIRGRRLHHLLYGEVDAQRPGSIGDVREVADEGASDATADHASTGLDDRAESDHGRDGGEVGVGDGVDER